MTQAALQQAVRRADIDRWQGDAATALADAVVVEEPLEIRAVFRDGRPERSLAITMRTPGDDLHLALGWLLGEAMIHGPSDVVRIESVDSGRPACGAVAVEFSPSVDLDLGKTQRHFHSTSSCGVCGKASLEGLGLDLAHARMPVAEAFDINVIHQLPALLRLRQANFDQTGGIHAAALFDFQGQLLDIREDIGRHNAVDKLLGAQMSQGNIPLDQRILMLSGRVSFEVLQKALRAGIAVVAAVGAPSSLAIDVAEQFSMTLLGFVRDDRCNVYAGRGRVRGHGAN